MEQKITIENNAQTKENWSKPELELIGINEETFGVIGNPNSDTTFGT